MKNLDITGNKYNKLTAIKFVSKDKYRTQSWLFQCECGNRSIFQKGAVVSGFIKSCCNNVTTRFKSTHGMTGTRFHNIWRGLKIRCNNKNTPYYKNYGGRGIKNLWASFEKFYKDMYLSYLAHVAAYGEKQTTIERENNNSHYCKLNCRWATYKEQRMNTRKRIKFNLITT